MPVSDTARPSVSVLKLAGPGLVVAATGIGSGDVVSATVGGARYGVMLLWAIAAGAFFKFVLQEGIARWQLATGKTALEGWADHLPAWVKWYFARLPRDLDGRGQRLADQRHRPRHGEPDRRRGVAIVGRGRAQPDRRAAHLLRRLQQLREADEGARRHHGLQHPVLRDVHAASADGRPCRACSCRPFPPAAAPTCCRSSAASAARSRCCRTTTGCAKRT